jgi:hypothetical protein
MAAPTRDAPASARAVANSRSPVAAATARKIAVVTSDPTELEGDGASLAVRGGVSLATADLTMGMLLGLAYRMVEADADGVALARRPSVYCPGFTDRSETLRCSTDCNTTR